MKGLLEVEGGEGSWQKVVEWVLEEQREGER